MACPTINYGVPSDGATEYNLNSGRELFRCGIECIKMFITNVSGERNTVKFGCADISDAQAGDVCMQSANATSRDQGVVNWIAKDGVTSALPNGYVINRADDCIGGQAVIYTHTEGNLSARVLANIESIAPNKELIKDRALNKLCSVIPEFCSELEWILSDLGVNVSPTDWQGGTVTYQGFGTSGNGYTTRRANFNWQNGRMEYATGTLTYDTTATPAPLEDIANTVLGI